MSDKQILEADGWVCCSDQMPNEDKYTLILLRRSDNNSRFLITLSWEIWRDVSDDEFFMWFWKPISRESLDEICNATANPT